MPPLFIAVEGFKTRGGGDEFKIKELCILDANKPLAPLYFTFKFTRQWCSLKDADKTFFHTQTRDRHQLIWDEGESRFCPSCVEFHIRQSFPAYKSQIFYMLACGLVEIDFVRMKLPMLNIMLYDTPQYSLPSLAHNILCPYREHGYFCAYLTCMRLYTDYSQKRTLSFL